MLRLTSVRDNLTHALEQSGTDEPTGTRTGLGHGLVIGSDAEIRKLPGLAAGGDITDLIWEAPPAPAPGHRRCSERASRHTRRVTPCTPQHWVIASFEHHCSPHGASHLHVHNIVVTALIGSSPATARPA